MVLSIVISRDSERTNRVDIRNLRSCDSETESGLALMDPEMLMRERELCVLVNAVD